MTASTLLHPLKLDVVGFQEDEHDYHFRVELPEPKCCESCGTISSLVKFGKDDQAYRDVPIHDKPDDRDQCSEHCKADQAVVCVRS